MRGKLAGPRNNFQGLLDEVFDTARPLRAAALSGLSDLGRSEIETLRGKWRDVAVGRRRKIVSMLSDMAEDNFELYFERVFIVATEDPDDEVRISSAGGLVLSDEGTVVAPLVKLLTHDESEAVRITAAKSLGKFVLSGELGKIPDSQAEMAREALLEVLESRKHGPELRRRALEAISPWSSPRVTQFIANAYRSEEPGLKVSAVYAMGMNCDARWLPALFAEMASEDPGLRYEAAHAAGETGEQSALSHLLPLLRDTDIEVRIASVWALGQIGGKAAKEALRATSADANDKVREAVEKALAETDVADDEFSL